MFEIEIRRSNIVIDNDKFDSTGVVVERMEWKIMLFEVSKLIGLGCII